MSVEGLAQPPAQEQAAAGMALGCHDVCFSYEMGSAAVQALAGVTFELGAGRSLALLGASGAGKSTLLQVIRGLDKAGRGAVRLDGVGPEAEAYAGLQRRVGLVFQAPELQLFAASCREDVAFGPRQMGWPDDVVAVAVDAALDLVGLAPERFAERHPYALSGGEQRRLALAGVLAMRPRLLLLDEPYASLDPGTRRELNAVLGDLRDSGVTLVLATHDVDVAWALCDEVLVLREGRVALSGVWDFGAAGSDVFAGDELTEPFLVRLWRRLGRDPSRAPRTTLDAARALA